MLTSSSSLSIHTTTSTTIPSNNNYNNNNTIMAINDTVKTTTTNSNNGIDPSNDHNDTHEKQQSLPIDTATMSSSTSRYTTATQITEDDNRNNKTMLPPSPPLLSPPYVEQQQQQHSGKSSSATGTTVQLIREHKQLLDIIENDLDSNSQVQGRLRAAIEALSIKYTTRYNTLLQSFENLESVHRNMVHEMVFQQNHYDKAVREMRFYKSQYEQLRQRQIRQQRTSPIFLDDDAILAWQRRISSASPINHHHSHSRHPTSTSNSGARTPLQRNMSFVSDNNESFCDSSACSSTGWTTCNSARSSIINTIPTHPQYTNNNNNRGSMVDLDYTHAYDTNQGLLLLQEDDENQTIDLMSVLAMSTDHQDRETMSTSPVKSLPIEIVGAGPNIPPPSDPPPPPSYPPPTTRTTPITPTTPGSGTTTITINTDNKQQGEELPDEKDDDASQIDPTDDNNNNESIMDPYIKMRAMPLIFACTEGFWNMIARGKNNKVEVDSLISNYLRRGGQPNVAKNSATIKSVKEGYGLIHALISVKNGSALARVVEAGANPNVVTLSSEPSDRTTPLVLAAQLNYLTGIRLLLERARADIFQRGPGQVTALHMALEHGADDDLVIYLVRASKNALLDIVDVEGATPLHYACKYGRIKAMVMFIRDCHVQLDPRDNKGETPLHYAVRQRRLKVITRLLGDFGVYPNYYVVKQTPTPLDLAKLGGFESISEYLRQMGAKTTKEMEKTANNCGSFASGGSNTSNYYNNNNSSKEVISSTSRYSGVTVGTSSTTTSSGLNSGITLSSAAALGTTSFSSSIISGTTTASSSRRSVTSTLSGSASIHSNSNESTMSRESGGSFSLSGTTMNIRNRFFNNH